MSACQTVKCCFTYKLVQMQTISNDANNLYNIGTSSKIQSRTHKYFIDGRELTSGVTFVSAVDFVLFEMKIRQSQSENDELSVIV